MRKLIVVLCVAALMLALAVPALANESIADVAPAVVTTGVEVEAIKAAEVEKVVEDFIKDEAKAEEVAKEIAKVASTDEEVSVIPADIVKTLAEKEEVAEQLKKVDGYRFSTSFAKLSGKTEAVEFKDATKDTKFLWIGPNGEIQVIEANEDGTYTFPGEGLIAQIDPAA